MKSEQFYSQAFEQAIQMYRSGIAKEKILYYLASEAEKASGQGAAVSILLLDDQGLLRNGASPRLPGDYLQAIDGLKPNPNVGTCAAAAATGSMVLTPSFYDDNKWAELRHLPLALGYVGAWSMPIKTPENKVLGTFGTYFRDKRQPSSEEIDGTALLASAVAIVLTGNEN